ncbi:MAG: DoxX family membrane protein, partial [Cryobacterium sp.]|nr:DoxX family membrane protein [Cryobacterium sp.]
IRLVLTIIFVYQSSQKFKDMKAFSKNDGVPLWLSWIVAIAEAAAAVSFATGILSQVAGLGVILLMLFTISMYIFVWHTKYWAQKGGWEYDILVILLAAVIVVYGAGPVAIPVPFLSVVH